MIIEYVHAALINNGIKTGLFSNEYTHFKKNKYLPMRRKIKKLDFNSDPDVFKKCAEIFNQYWKDILSFESDVNKNTNSKLHTSFLEEFSCYFVEKIPEFKGFSVFKEAVFAGLKINTDQTVSVITKDVDFCIGKLVPTKFGKTKEQLKIPIVSVEMKTYTEKTMLGEITNTARKLKGANPQSKVILLTWVKNFTRESILESASEGFIDEIVVMSEQKRKSGQPTPVEFTEKGLKAYWEVLTAAFIESLKEYRMPNSGRLLAYAKFFAGINNQGS